MTKNSAIPDYVRKLGVTYDVPAEFSNLEVIKCGYTVPEHEKGNVVEGLRRSNIKDQRGCSLTPSCGSAQI